MHGFVHSVDDRDFRDAEPLTINLELTDVNDAEPN